MHVMRRLNGCHKLQLPSPPLKRPEAPVSTRRNMLGTSRRGGTPDVRPYLSLKHLTSPPPAAECTAERNQGAPLLDKRFPQKIGHL